MPDNTDEEHLDNSMNAQPENSTGETIATLETVAINTNQETENMEVHHHPDLHHKPKKWKEYFLEFVMIFLAVTLGFFAESYREHLVENKKEVEYMHSLIQDLKADTALMTQSIKFNKGICRADSLLLTLLNAPTKDSQTLHKLFQLNENSKNFYPQINDSKTFDQLNSSGDYRFIKNEQVRNSIAKYYQHISMAKAFATEIQSNLQLTYNISYKIFDQYAFDNKANTTVPLITNDVALLKEYSNNLYNLELSYKMYCEQNMEHLKKEAVNLTSLLEKEYP
ncbi:hypothetical protein [Flavobacterium gilvum]|uniref:Uncharacterized protein n=1 Tax=Flavobacterium gilvum TaxID=1492737 RepID=A0AAC9I7B8_9FLAO|nr:hypothetical protein [Flavobacterium gilvum]AOW10413.1 hypothetical protein EM308_13385 [Flavobacterium gilvum]KFC59040.1 hypothetical protein FEM08_21720 [Flavobacterium gilvum]